MSVVTRSDDADHLNRGGIIARYGDLKILDAVYAAAHGEMTWERSLEILADGLGYHAATLEYHNIKRGGLLHMETARIDPGNLVVYQQDFTNDNPRHDFLVSSQASILHDHMFMTESEMDHHRFYADFLRPRGLRYFLSVGSQVFDQEIKGVIALHRPGGVAGADEAGIDRLGHLKPHLMRAQQVFWNRIKLDADPEFFERRLLSYSLTAAEQRLARSIAYGEGLTDYAGRCHLSINTVYTHYRRIKSKLDCRSQAALITRLQSIARGEGPAEISRATIH